jgi:hypothetical protein
VNGFGLFLTFYNPAPEGRKQVTPGRPLFGSVDRRSVEARARFHLSRKMAKAYLAKGATICMKAVA